MKTLDIRSLPEDRLATTDEKGRRVYVHPADVHGRYQKLRVMIHAVMILFFLVLPWIRINGQQALLLDIYHRRFAIFGLTFWAHDAPILLFVLASGAFFIAFVTAVWGRIWCGWGCPQTVFIENVFRKIEHWVEGDAVARRKLDQSSLGAKKIFKKGLKWFLFLIVSLIITHSFLAYFVGAPELLKMIQMAPSFHPTSFLVIVISTGIILFDFGWFREQFCIIACPYGRFQSVLMDERSLAVLYDAKRGEPRRGVAADKEHQGDCVDCYRCIDVCPTGIDIRRGVQMECVACTACIDACDDVMARLKKPKGLIRYDSYLGINRLKAKSRWGWRPFVYLGLMSIALTGLVYVLLTRQDMNFSVVRGKDSPYVEEHQRDSGNTNSSDDLKASAQKITLTNHFRLHVANENFEETSVRFVLPSEFEGKNIQLIMPFNPFPVIAGKEGHTDLFVKFPKQLLTNGRMDIPLEAHWMANGKDKSRVLKLPLLGPFQ